MRLLKIGKLTLGVDSAIESLWPALEGEAFRQAAERGDSHPHIRFHTDTGVTGSIPVWPTIPLRFSEGEPDEHFLGTVISVDAGDGQVRWGGPASASVADDQSEPEP